MILTNTLSVLKRLLTNTRQFHNSRIRKAYEAPTKTTLTFSEAGDTFLIDKCVPVGFQLSNKSIIVGPLAIFPQSLFSWDIISGKDINEETLSLFTVLYPPPDVLILGLETEYERKDILKIKKVLRKYHIRNEIHPVQYACGIYNHLICEGRHVAAGLIPPLVEQFNLPKKLVLSGNRNRK